MIQKSSFDKKIKVLKYRTVLAFKRIAKSECPFCFANKIKKLKYDDILSHNFNYPLKLAQIDST